jgi:N-acetylmuramoyl-L-alanine amidase
MAKVGLDIGHGRNTFPPSKGLYKDGVAYHEHNFNAQVGIALESILSRHGIQVVKAQIEFQDDVPLSTRTDIYDRENVDITVSIHANAGTPTAKGIGVFYWHTSTSGKRLADLYIDEVKKAGLDVWGSGVIASIPGTWTNFHMVREPNAPSILSENGFMTNAEDFERIFKDPGYAKKVAEAHGKAICRYFGITYKESEEKWVFTDKVTVPNTAYWQANLLVEEYQEKGFKCYALPAQYKPFETPKASEPYPFVVETDFKNANLVLMELKKSYPLAKWETI